MHKGLILRVPGRIVRLWGLALLLGVVGCRLLEPGGSSVAVITRADLTVHTSPHRVGLMDSGWLALALRIKMIREAEESIELQTFIWSEDQVGKLVAYELVRAARRGVTVRVLSDGMHTRLSHEFAASLATANERFEWCLYSPRGERISASWAELVVDGALDFDELNRRAHDKLMIVDKERALIGGRNIENTYFDYAAGMNFQDREVLVEGAVVSDALASFERFWEYELTVSAEQLRDVQVAIQSGNYARVPHAPMADIEEIYAEIEATLESHPTRESLVSGEMIEVAEVAFCCDDPGRKVREQEGGSRNRVTRTLGGLVRGAEKTVLAQTPYFTLSDRALEMLAELRAEHPDILLEASSNSLASTDIFPAQAVAYRQKRQFIEELGIHLYEFKALPGDIESYIERYPALVGQTGQQPTLCLHSKSIVVDGEVGGVGSHNLGPRSSELNSEVMLFVWDHAFVSALEESIRKDMQPQNSWVVWKRDRDPAVSSMQSLMEQLSHAVGDVTTIDVWPSFYASSFALRDGFERVSPDHPDFYRNYEEVGLFPGLPLRDEKVWMTRLFKAIGGLADPLL